ncbi:hypothetical protein Bca4012_090528 [Brassica carinata]
MALSLLRKNKHGFDIVISDVHMPDMDGFKLLEHVGLEMDLPVIMMSADDSKSVVLKGVTHGAVDYLIKPVRMEVLKNIWQHVVRKKRSVPEHSRSVEETGERQQQQRGAEDDNASSGNNSRKRKEQEGEEDASNLKKPRVVWSVELHQQFVAAVNQLGVEMSGEIPPAVDELMENNLEDARAYAVMPLSAFEFEVTLKTTGFGSSVNLETRSCTYLEFQKVGIPCRHAIAAAMFRDLQHSEFVADAYLKKKWNETTKGVTLPVPDPQDLFIPSEVSDLIMLPPKTKRPPGRPPTKRKRSAGEILDDEEGDYWEWMQMDTDVDDDASDWTDDTLSSGEFRDDNYPDSSGTDSSTSDSD